MPKRRMFTSLNHPKPKLVGWDDRGKEVFAQLYSVHEIFHEDDAPGGIRREMVADDLTSVEVTKFIRENEGRYEDA